MYYSIATGLLYKVVYYPNVEVTKGGVLCISLFHGVR